ncbi:MAG TPA: DUF4340 domain-containing protein, partial [Tepidisphaeraceae bacterium]|nr:DUF4340 domain-containing protein [Tepidisphaeraceae bacterium]
VQTGKTVRLDKQKGEWEITEPKTMPADSGAVSSLLTSIADLNASDFVSSPSAPAVYGLTSPTLTVSYSLTGAPPATQPTSHQIAFGRFATIERNEVYVSVDGGPVATVSSTTADNFKKTALDLRDKKVVDIDPAHVTGFTLGVNKSATTQPTTKPAETYEYTIARRKESTAFGPLPPPGPATQPATQATTQTATTEPTSQPAVASTQPASKWVFESGATGPANDTEVENLLTALHPLQASKFVEKSPTTEPAAGYTLTIHVGPANGKGPQDLVLHFMSPGATGDVTGTYEGLTFETDRSILEKLDAKFSGK